MLGIYRAGVYLGDVCHHGGLLAWIPHRNPAEYRPAEPSYRTVRGAIRRLAADHDYELIKRQTFDYEQDERRNT